MYNRHIEDPDGYVWEILWMNAWRRTPGAPST